MLSIKNLSPSHPFYLLMNAGILLFAVILMWIGAIAGVYRRIFIMPAWFVSPPSSFELIRRQGKTARLFWVPLTVVFVYCIGMSLVIYWNTVTVRDYILLAAACYILNYTISAVYFSREIKAFIKIPPDAPATPELLWRTTNWLRWTIVRDILQVFTAIFLTLAYNHL